jgi:hypothetical protein
MKMYSGAAPVGIALLAAALAAPNGFGQDQPPLQGRPAPAPATQPDQIERPEPKHDLHRVTFGAIGTYFITGSMTGKDITNTETTAGSISVDYNGSATPQKYDYGPMLEFRLSHRLSFVTGAMYHPVKFRLVTTNTYNPPIPRGLLLNVTDEQSSGRVFDFPVLMRFRNIKAQGPVSHVFFEGGGNFRILSNIKTATTNTFNDNSTTTSNAPLEPNKRTVTGVMAGAGLRFTDELGIHVSPEMRYTHWFDSNITQQGITFPKSQVEIGLSFSF